MKKRIVSFMCVLVVVFTGAFSCLASADGGVISKYFNFWKRYIESIDSPWDVTSPGFYSFLTDYLTDQKEAASSPPPVGGRSVNIEFTDPEEEPLHYSFDSGISLFPECSNCKFFAYVEEFPSIVDYSRAYTQLAIVYFIAVPNQYADLVNYTFSNGRDILRATDSITYYEGRFDCEVDRSTGLPYFSRMSFYYRSGTDLYTSTTWANTHTGHPEIYDNPNGHSFDCYYTLLNEFTTSQLSFSSDFYITSDLLDITLYSNRPVLSDIDGYLAVTFGIIYDNGSDRMYAGSFYSYGTIQDFQDEWHDSFDLSDFAEYAYRKRCGLDGYIGFVAVMDQSGDCIYASERELTLDPPGGVFDDIDEPPKWPDYKPDPSPAPEPPTYIFNNNITTQRFQDFNWTTINNFTFNIGGGSGGSGGDSSSESDPSSGSDSSSGSDDSSDDQDFQEWFGDSVTTINENMGNAYTTINNNLEILGSNISAYLEAILDYLHHCLYDTLDYIAKLIIKFNNDFNAWADAFGNFISDSADTLNGNIVVVGDNIVKAIKMQVVPDKENVYDIASSNFPFVSSFRTMISEHEVEEKDLIVSIPTFGSDASFDVDLVDRRVRASGDRAGSSINSVDGDCVTYNLTEILGQYDLPRFRSVGSVFILASTFFSLINITLKIFGLNFAR